MKINRVNFLRREGGGEVKFLTYENVSICNDYSVSDIFRFRTGVKFSRWGKNQPGVHK